MNYNINEKYKIIIELCKKISDKLTSYSSDGDTYKEYDIPIIDDYVTFSTTLNYYEYYQIIKYKNILLRLNIRQYKNSNEYIVNYKLGKDEISIDDEISNDFLNEIIDKLNQFYIEHERRNTPESTITILESLCSENVKILLHETDYCNVDNILKQGLKIWNIGLSCRTTVMVDNDVNKILSYKYSEFSKPRTIIIAIPNLNSNKVISDDKYIMDKCRNCTAKITEGYDNWCYANNYEYEMIAKETDLGWVIPKEFIFGYIDYNGNITLNDNYLTSKEKTTNNKSLNLKKSY